MITIENENPLDETLPEQTPANDVSPDQAMPAAESRLFNRLAVEMTFYHNRFRAAWNELYAGVAPGATTPSESRILFLGLSFCHGLQGHHDIEEAYWFPVLGTKMEAFRQGGFASVQHEEMHRGLDKLAPYLEACRKSEKTLDRAEVRDIMDSFGKVLWKHLDDEVNELGAKNMKKYWTKDEMRNLPF